MKYYVPLNVGRTSLRLPYLPLFEGYDIAHCTSRYKRHVQNQLCRLRRGHSSFNTSPPKTQPKRSKCTPQNTPHQNLETSMQSLGNTKPALQRNQISALALVRFCKRFLQLKRSNHFIFTSTSAKDSLQYGFDGHSALPDTSLHAIPISMPILNCQILLCIPTLQERLEFASAPRFWIVVGLTRYTALERIPNAVIAVQTFNPCHESTAKRQVHERPVTKEVHLTIHRRSVIKEVHLTIQKRSVTKEVDLTSG